VRIRVELGRGRVLLVYTNNLHWKIELRMNWEAIWSEK